MEITGHGLPLSGSAGAERAIGGAIGKGAAPSSGSSFADVLMKLVRDVNHEQTQADAAMQSLAAGGSADLHRVMIALNKADLSMRLLVEVRNRALEAYQEISRLPV